MYNQSFMKNIVAEPNSGSEEKNDMDVERNSQRLPLRRACGQAVYEAACGFAGNAEELTVKSASDGISPSRHGRLSAQAKEKACFASDGYISCGSQAASKKALTISGFSSIRTDGGKFINTADLMMLSDEQVMEICRLSGPHLEYLNFHLLMPLHLHILPDLQICFLKVHMADMAKIPQ